MLQQKFFFETGKLTCITYLIDGRNILERKTQEKMHFFDLKLFKFPIIIELKYGLHQLCLFQKSFQHRGDSIDINKVETKVFVSNY